MADTELIKKLREHMNKTVETLRHELSTIRTGRANPAMLDIVKVDYYGFPTPLNQIATITVPEPRQILIKPFERSQINPIEKAIRNAPLGLNPQNDGENVRINIPALTEERRKEMTKVVNKLTEEARVAIRNIRRDANDGLKKDKNMPEDLKKRNENDIQKLTDEIIKKVDEMAKLKDKEIMTI